MGSVLIVTGMHRSATSLVASLVRRGGVEIGDRLLAASSDNPRGFFEDEDFFAFHQGLLHSRGETALACEFEFTPRPEEVESARALIRAREHRAVWGWKDPRTSLFLDFWHGLLPDAVFLLLYRHPLEVLWSLVRRREPMADLMQGLDSWRFHNERILRFGRAHPERCLLYECHAVVANPDVVSRQVSEKSKIPLHLDTDAVKALYHASELKRLALSSGLQESFSRAYPEVERLYRDLESSADLPSSSTGPDHGDAPDASTFEACVKAVPPRELPSQARGLLNVLMASIDAAGTDGAAQKSRTYLREVRTAEIWLKDQNRALQAEVQKLTSDLEAQREWSRSLERDKAAIDEGHKARWDELHAWAQELERAKATLARENQELLASTQELLAGTQALEGLAASLRMDVARAAAAEESAKNQLHALRQSTRWRITSVPWKLAGRIAPAGSLRGRVLGKIGRGLASLSASLGG